MIYLIAFSTTTNFFSTMSGDETAELVITKDIRLKNGKDCFKDQFHFLLLTELVRCIAAAQLILKDYIEGIIW